MVPGLKEAYTTALYTARLYRMAARPHLKGCHGPTADSRTHAGTRNHRLRSKPGRPYGLPERLPVVASPRALRAHARRYPRPPVPLLRGPARQAHAVGAGPP